MRNTLVLTAAALILGGCSAFGGAPAGWTSSPSPATRRW